MKKILFTAFAATLFAASCQKTEIVGTTPVNGPAMTFSTEMKKITKADPTADAEEDENLHAQGFYVWAYADFDVTNASNVDKTTNSETYLIYDIMNGMKLTYSNSNWSAPENMEYYLKCRINGRQFVIVHAGYTDSIEEDMDDSYDSLEEFYLYARDDAYIFGGIRHGIVVAGHTPTTLEEELPYNDGNVYQAYDKDMDCKFYDIDCGCASRGKIPNAKLACIRLDDEKIFYI